MGKLSLMGVIALLNIFLVNTAFATSGKLKFSGSFVKEVCAIETTHIINIPTDNISKNVPFNFNFSKCDITPNLVNIEFHDKSTDVTTSNDITFKILENTKKVIERDGKRTYLPMYLTGNYHISNKNQSKLKQVTVNYY